jgi:hypothetical protein
VQCPQAQEIQRDWYRDDCACADRPNLGVMSRVIDGDG